MAVRGDLRKADDCACIVAEAVAAFGRLDILVNNDGAPPLGPSLDFEDVAWPRAVEQNLLSVVRLSRAERILELPFRTGHRTPRNRPRYLSGASGTSSRDHGAGGAGQPVDRKAPILLKK